MSSHSDSVSVYLICMASKEREREEAGEGKKGRRGEKGWIEEQQVKEIQDIR